MKDFMQFLALTNMAVWVLGLCIWLSIGLPKNIGSILLLDRYCERINLSSPLEKPCSGSILSAHEASSDFRGLDKEAHFCPAFSPTGLHLQNTTCYLC